MTGRDLISASMRLLGVLASGETPTANEASDALASLNRMIDSWSTEGLLVYAITQESPLTLTGGQASYTLGLGGNLTTRPLSIEAAFIRDGSVDYPVRIISLDQFSRITNKSIQSTYPDSLYDDGGYPQRTITLYPVPSAAKQLILFTRDQLTSIATLDTVLSLPPGYERALTYNGAVELSPEYGKQISEVVGDIAIQSKAAIKRANKRPSYLRCEQVLTPNGSWNINTGDYRR